MDLSVFFGAKKAKAKKAKKAKKSPGRKPLKMVKVLKKEDAYIMVGNRKRRLYLGKNGGLFYRTKSGRNYVDPAVLRRKNHVLSPKKKKAAKKVAKKLKMMKM